MAAALGRGCAGGGGVNPAGPGRGPERWCRQLRGAERSSARSGAAFLLLPCRVGSSRSRWCWAGGCAGSSSHSVFVSSFSPVAREGGSAAARPARAARRVTGALRPLARQARGGGDGRRGAAGAGTRRGAAEGNGVSAVWARPWALRWPGRGRAVCGGSLSGRGGAAGLDLCCFLSGSG